MTAKKLRYLWKPYKNIMLIFSKDGSNIHIPSSISTMILLAMPKPMAT